MHTRTHTHAYTHLTHFIVQLVKYSLWSRTIAKLHNYLTSTQHTYLVGLKLHILYKIRKALDTSAKQVIYPHTVTYTHSISNSDTRLHNMVDFFMIIFY